MTSTVNHCEDEQRFLLRRVGNQQAPYNLKANRPRSKVEPNMTLVGKRDQFGNRPVNFFQNAISRINIARADVLPNFFQISDRFRMKNKAAHQESRRSALLRRNASNASSPSSGVTRPLRTSS